MVVGANWLAEQIYLFVDTIERVSPSAYSEMHRYLPESVTPIPGPMRFDVNPFAREIVDCFDVDSPVREVNVRKGVQITWTTILESMMLYAIGHIKTLPCIYMTADKDLADGRIKANIIPMLHESGFIECIQSADTGNKRKTGMTKDMLQWRGGGYMIPLGANAVSKFRQVSAAFFWKDELDAWGLTKDGDSDALSDDRCAAYWNVRKISRGSTPLIKGSSIIDKQFARGDQRKYMVRCLSCGHPQELRWSGTNEETKRSYGMIWELDSDGALLHESVKYRCCNCAHDHGEYDKDRLFSPEQGAEWVPTAKPKEPFIRSYHLPALYSPAGMQPWYKSVASYLEAWDVEAKRPRDIGKLQVFYNNVLAESFEVRGSRVTAQQVSAHRRAEFKFSEIPNAYAAQYSGSRILFLTCQVDVHKHWIQVAVMGWTYGARCYLVEYLKFEDNSEEGCESVDSPVWAELTEVIEKRTWTSADRLEYRVALTAIDAGYAPDAVVTFCAKYDEGVLPILGRDRPAKYQRIEEFAEYTTKSGTVGYRILVDHYKDRLAPVLRREWHPESGVQPEYHFNAPSDVTSKALKELTAEIRREKTDERGNVTYEWYRSGVRNEMWDLLVYGHACVEIMAWQICVGYYELESVDPDVFWGHFEEV